MVLYNKFYYFVNRYLYIIFTILTLVELYKLFIRLITINQDVTIVKFISQKNDLSAEQKYNSFNPELFIPKDNRHIHYEANIYNYINYLYNNSGIENSQRNKEIQTENNNVSPNEISNNINNKNDNNINKKDNNSNIFIYNQRNNNLVNIDSINEENEHKINSTRELSTKSEMNN